MSSKRVQQGVGLTEVMVALLLLSVGVLGFVALQVRASTAGGESFARTQAVAIFEDMAARVILNFGQINYYATAGNWGNAGNLTACETADCTPAQLAQYDIDNVINSAATLLPNGQVALRECVDSAPGNVHHCIFVSWDDTTPTVGGGDADCLTAAGRYRDGATCFTNGVD